MITLLKSQLSSFIFVFNTLFYAYEHPNLLQVKFLYFNYEESPEEVLMRFMSFCLYKFTGFKTRISPLELQSPDEKRKLSDENLQLLKSEKYKKLFEFFVEKVEFCEERTDVAIDIKVKAYAMENGTCTYKTAYYKDEFGETHTTKSIDTYTPNNPDLYTFLFFDHISLLNTTKGQTLLQAIGNVSKNCVKYKNLYKFTIVMIQQQSKELGNLESSKQGRIRPDDTFLADCKSTVNDVTHFWGICDAYALNAKEYLGYDLNKLKHCFRVLELIFNRKGQGGKLLPLYFDGAVCYFNVLPAPTDKDKLEKVYKLIENNEVKQEQKNKSNLLTLLSKIKHQHG